MLPQPMALEFDLIAVGFFLLIAAMPQRMLKIASFGRANPLSPKEVIGWRIFAGFFAISAALQAISKMST
jgi:hypothetical protein